MYTVYATRKTTLRFRFALIGPWLPTLLFIAGTAILLIEGSICIAMALPIFLFMASVGGVIAWCVLKFVRPSSTTVYSLFALPFLTSAFEATEPMHDRIEMSQAEVHIGAPPETIWKLINHATNIQPSEMQGGWAYRIGVPYPVEAITQVTGNQRIRELRWQKNVAFDEPIVDWKKISTSSGPIISRTIRFHRARWMSMC
jgi:hypothetical protein